MKKNTSEKVFEQFCATNATHCERIATDDGKTPDYKVEIGGARIVVEVKELQQNDMDKKVVQEWNARPDEFHSWEARPGKRIRAAIESAKHQIKSLAEGKCPGILLLYDTRPYPLRGFDSLNPHEIKVGMYGFETIAIRVSEDTAEPPRFGPHTFGKGKKVGRDYHSYISALGVLRESSSSGKYHVDLYLNDYADSDHPLPLCALVARSDFTVRRLGPGRQDEFRDWEIMAPEDDK